MRSCETRLLFFMGIPFFIFLVVSLKKIPSEIMLCYEDLEDTLHSDASPETEYLAKELGRHIKKKKRVNMIRRSASIAACLCLVVSLLFTALYFRKHQDYMKTGVVFLTKNQIKSLECPGDLAIILSLAQKTDE